jgi:hypothetical protein
MDAGSPSPIMQRILVRIGIFLVMMVMMTIVCMIFWQAYVNEKLYDCTDACGFDYLQPGNWIHGHLAVVQHIVHHRSMSEPDTIKEGWSVEGLWCLWLTFFAVSIMVSTGFALLPWIPKRDSSANGAEN